jgi:hypothetical protein
MLDLDHTFTPVTWLFEYDENISTATPRVSLDITADGPIDWGGIADRAEQLGAVRKSTHEQGGIE